MKTSASFVPDARRTTHDAQLRKFADLLLSLNRSINLISKHTEKEVWERHVEHCLNLASQGFPAGSTVVDWGSGGGLPAIPLAIRFPEVRFVAVDSVGKKMQAVRAMARKLSLANLEAWHGRAEQWSGSTQYSVSRATAPLATLWEWHSRVAGPVEEAPPGCWEPGLICLKGGDLSEEIENLKCTFPSVTVHCQSIDPAPPIEPSAARYLVHVRNT